MRLHSIVQAGESARALNAKAYSVGQDVVFGTGQYTPGTGEGQKLMAHELTHVVQQSGEKKLMKKPSVAAENPARICSYSLRVAIWND